MAADTKQFAYDSSLIEQSFVVRLLVSPHTTLQLAPISMAFVPRLAHFIQDPAASQSWGSLLSPSRLERIWPYTLDHGLGQTCHAAVEGCYDPEWIYPGLWEVMRRHQHSALCPRLAC